MKFERIEESKIDDVTKYIFLTESNYVVEFSYIDKKDGKDIICVPCQTMCNQGCLFCHTIELKNKIETINLTNNEIFYGIEFIFEDRHLINNDNILLVSYMGCGEPMENVENIIVSMVMVNEMLPKRNIRFGLATSIPDINVLEFFKFTKLVKEYNLDVKLHLSLHYISDKLRNKWMPKALNIKPSIDAFRFYGDYTGNRLEIHYALIDGLNDTINDALLLANLLKGIRVSIKILFYNKREKLDIINSNNYELFREVLNEEGLPCEYYIPPGLDIGSSCGQFLIENYLRK